MGYYKKQRMKMIIKLIISFIVLIALSAVFSCYIYTPDDYAYKIICNCGGIAELNDYVSYNMLSHQLKKYINKNDLKFSSMSTEELMKTSEKLASIDYEYKSDSEFIRSTATFKQDPLSDYIIYNGKTYSVNYEIIFAPRLFSLKPKIVDWNVSIRESKLQTFE